jgi:hypothetical protein
VNRLYDFCDPLCVFHMFTTTFGLCMYLFCLFGFPWSGSSFMHCFQFHLRTGRDYSLFCLSLPKRLVRWVLCACQWHLSLSCASLRSLPTSSLLLFVSIVDIFCMRYFPSMDGHILYFIYFRVIVLFCISFFSRWVLLMKRC